MASGGAYRRTISVELPGRKIGKAIKRGAIKIEVGMGTVTRDVARRGVAGAESSARSMGGVQGHVVDEGAIFVQGGNNIRLDPRKSPAVFGATFGGGRRPTTRQFPPWLGSGYDAGYLLYPDLRALRLEAVVANIIDRAL
jgi:hypothetical protein